MEFIELAELCDKGLSNLAQKDLVFDSGIYPVYGAPGEITKVDFFHQSKPYLGLIKDGAGVGRVMQLPANSSVIGTIQYIFPKENVDLKYLYYLIKYLDLGKANTGATIPHIYFKDYKKRKVKVREYSEQKHIGQILELIDSHLRTYKKVLEQYDLLIKSRFVEMFGDPNMVALNKSVKFSSIAKIITGNTPSRKSPEYYGDYIEWIKSDNIISTNLYISQAKEFLSEQGAAKGRVAPKDSLLMTCIAGSIRSIGNVGICDRSVAFNQQINAIVLKNNINPLYIYWLLKLFKPSIIANVEMSLKGIISKSHLENMLIPIIASQEEQELFIKFALQINKLKADVQKSIDKAQLLMDSLMQEYFG
ncbi:restriction endonuclease subunit S [Veillonella sp. ACP1]|uniref:restriction endonuclease subunit S n=1 Tax=Veillonella sp. ACP1 TaxID=936588 RepID=UPI0002780138|nr:restriction endonuclease subunit S [Veillonella sp. ACP1]EJO49730.1 type I restriction modification DNA specificity domain protein [Veillonella sp. ACP1]